MKLTIDDIEIGDKVIFSDEYKELIKKNKTKSKNLLLMDKAEGIIKRKDISTVFVDWNISFDTINPKDNYHIDIAWLSKI